MRVYWYYLLSLNGSVIKTFRLFRLSLRLNRRLCFLLRSNTLNLLSLGRLSILHQWLFVFTSKIISKVLFFCFDCLWTHVFLKNLDIAVFLVKLEWVAHWKYIHCLGRLLVWSLRLKGRSATLCDSSLVSRLSLLSTLVALSLLLNCRFNLAKVAVIRRSSVRDYYACILLRLFHAIQIVHVI